MIICVFSIDIKLGVERTLQSVGHFYVYRCHGYSVLTIDLLPTADICCHLNNKLQLPFCFVPVNDQFNVHFTAILWFLQLLVTVNGVFWVSFYGF